MRTQVSHSKQDTLVSTVRALCVARMGGVGRHVALPPRHVALSHHQPPSTILPCAKPRVPHTVLHPGLRRRHAGPRSRYKEDGVAAFYRGLAASVLLCVNPAIYNTVFDQLKARLLARIQARSGGRRVVALSTLQAFALGVIAKAIATLLTYPYIRAKMVMQAASRAKRENTGTGAAASGAGAGGSAETGSGAPEAGSGCQCGDGCSCGDDATQIPDVRRVHWGGAAVGVLRGAVVPPRRCHTHGRVSLCATLGCGMITDGAGCDAAHREDGGPLRPVQGPPSPAAALDTVVSTHVDGKGARVLLHTPCIAGSRAQGRKLIAPGPCENMIKISTYFKY